MLGDLTEVGTVENRSGVADGAGGAGVGNAGVASVPRIAGAEADVLVQVYDRLGLSALARALVEEIRAAPPTRRVRSAAGNVAVRFPSRKMGMTIQAESH